VKTADLVNNSTVSNGTNFSVQSAFYLWCWSTRKS